MVLGNLSVVSTEEIAGEAKEQKTVVESEDVDLSENLQEEAGPEDDLIDDHTGFDTIDFCDENIENVVDVSSVQEDLLQRVMSLIMIQAQILIRQGTGISVMGYG